MMQCWIYYGFVV